MSNEQTRGPGVSIAGLTDIGIVREENQDSLLLESPSDEGVLASRGVLVAVADGMGGLQGGKIASQLAIDTVLEKYYGSPGDPGRALVDGVQRAGRIIYDYSVEKAGGQSMGSTLTAVAILKDHACVAHVGDSRAYRYRDGDLRQVTRDHSLLRELQEQVKELRPEYADSFHMHRHVLTRGLGLRDDVEVDLFELADVSEGDLFLLSTDGLHELVNEEELIDAIECSEGDLEKACRDLVRKARDRGGPDNITIALALIGSMKRPKKKVAEEPLRLVESSGAPGIAGPAERDAASRDWFLPMSLFIAFLAGVGATLLLEERPARVELEELRESVDGLLRGDPRREELIRRIQELQERLER